MIYVFILAVAGVGFAVYLLVMYGSIPGAIEERLGTLEALPEDLNRWAQDLSSSEGRQALDVGQIREVRHRLESARGLFSRGKLIRQVRYRDGLTREIVRVEPEQRFCRKRTKSSA